VTAADAPSLPARAALARRVALVVNGVSRWAGVGGGTVIGGRAALAVDPELIERLSAGRRVVLVSGTNGKTTTTALVAAALAAGAPGRRIVTNATGSNMPAGHAAALAAGPRGVPTVLEVDEGYLPATLAHTRPEAVVLLNLSRDQLDRTNEVRMLAGRWRTALAGPTGTLVVANADDPLIAWAAGTGERVVWVGAGLGWRADATGCPACDGQIAFAEGPAGGWACACGFARPDPAVWTDDGGATPEVVFADGRRQEVSLAIPGRFNRSNAVMALALSESLGVDPAAAADAMAAVTEVAGRFTTRVIDGVATRLLLAKNPAGWSELLGLVGPGTTPVVVGINARVADGRDPSWLWDVEFERLSGRPVVATGDRCLDVSVRLHYAGVEHVTVREPADALEVAAQWAAAGRPVPLGVGAGATRVDGDGAPASGVVDFIGNYTAFSDLVRLR